MPARNGHQGRGEVVPGVEAERDLWRSLEAVNTFAALLRGVNVGGKNKVPMAGLRSLLESAGYADVVTYVQSGNVVLRSSSRSAAKTESRLEGLIAEAFGSRIAVLLRTPAELRRIASENPFLAGKAELSRLYVVFLRTAPKPEAVERLDPHRSPGDEYRLAGNELFLQLPSGAGQTKLTLDYFERTLGVDGTARNWNTLLRLVELTG